MRCSQENAAILRAYIVTPQVQSTFLNRIPPKVQREIVLHFRSNTNLLETIKKSAWNFKICFFQEKQKCA